MRLIDVDVLIKNLNNSDAQFDAEVNRIILEQPTAYDVDRVVEELGEATWQYNPPFNDEPYRMVILSNKAVQIAKRGGVDDI